MTRDLRFFHFGNQCPHDERFGFEDEGLLIREEMHRADIHLMCKRL